MNRCKTNPPFVAVSKGTLLPRCVMCDQVPPGGLRDGIRLKRAFICTQCEQKLTHSHVGSLYYQTMLEKIKAILK
jgi:hypothetical protein